MGRIGLHPPTGGTMAGVLVQFVVASDWLPIVLLLFGLGHSELCSTVELVVDSALA